MSQMEEEMDPPQHILSDYVEMFSLSIMFVIGAPLNLAAFTQLTEKQTCTRLDLLKKHLNTTDLLVLFIYVPSRAIWLLTYDWRGGDFLCKSLKMLHNFSFQASSNVIVCIALDRLLSVLSPSHNSRSRAQFRVKIMLVVAWSLAFVMSIPQLFIWQNYLAVPSHNWRQCLPIWQIIRHQNASAPRMFDDERRYSVFHVSCIFWIPLAMILTSYAAVLTWVWVNSRPSISNSDSTQTFSMQTACDTVDTVLLRSHNNNNKVAWNPMKTISSNVESDNEHGRNHMSYKAPLETPRIVVSDESEVPLRQRPSLAVSENLSIGRSGIHTNVSYQASVTRSRALRVSFLLVAAYIVCWLPYNLLSLIRILDQQFFDVHMQKFYFFHEFVIFNSVVNPYLYGFFRRRTTAA